MAQQPETTPATADAVLTALDAAHVALMDAALVVASRYGQGAMQAVQLCGAAAMITDDWMPAIRAEVTQ